MTPLTEDDKRPFTTEEFFTISYEVFNDVDVVLPPIIVENPAVYCGHIGKEDFQLVLRT
jgi:hypothetical protein